MSSAAAPINKTTTTVVNPVASGAVQNGSVSISSNNFVKTTLVAQASQDSIQQIRDGEKRFSSDREGVKAGQLTPKEMVAYFQLLALKKNSPEFKSDALYGLKLMNPHFQQGVAAFNHLDGNVAGGPIQISQAGDKFTIKLNDRSVTIDHAAQKNKALKADLLANFSNGFKNAKTDTRRSVKAYEEYGKLAVALSATPASSKKQTVVASTATAPGGKPAGKPRQPVAAAQQQPVDDVTKPLPAKPVNPQQQSAAQSAPKPQASAIPTSQPAPTPAPQEPVVPTTTQDVGAMSTDAIAKALRASGQFSAYESGYIASRLQGYTSGAARDKGEITLDAILAQHKSNQKGMKRAGLTEDQYFRPGEGEDKNPGMSLQQRLVKAYNVLQSGAVASPSAPSDVTPSSNAPTPVESVTNPDPTVPATAAAPISNAVLPIPDDQKALSVSFIKAAQVLENQSTDNTDKFVYQGLMEQENKVQQNSRLLIGLAERGADDKPTQVSRDVLTNAFSNVIQQLKDQGRPKDIIDKQQHGFELFLRVFDQMLRDRASAV